MTSKLTRERLAEIAQFGFSSAITPANDFEIKELARMALAAMDSKPVFFIEVEGDDWINAGRTEGKNRQDLGLLPDGINYLYAAPQPPTDAEREELQELRRSYLALRGENEDLQAQLYEAESQADDAAEEPQERRKADSESVAEVLSNRPGNGTSIVDVALPVGTQLYLHAQPVPVVLDEVTAEDCPAFVKYDVTEVDEAWVRGFNACRAATLQASNCRENSNSSTNNFREILETSTNSPVIPDTWIPVSERMPDENAEQQVLASFKGGDISTLYYFEGRWDDAYGIAPIRQDVTHWMPLPAAPQEGK